MQKKITTVLLLGVVIALIISAVLWTMLVLEVLSRSEFNDSLVKGLSVIGIFTLLGLVIQLVLPKGR